MLELLMVLIKTGVIGGTVGGIGYGLYRGIQRVGLHWIDRAGTQVIKGVSKLIGTAFTLLGKTVKTVGKGLAKGGKVALKGSKICISKLNENRRLKKAEKAYRDGLLNEDAFLDEVRNKGSKNGNRNASYRQNRGMNQNNYPYSNNRYNNQSSMYSNNTNMVNGFENITLSPSCLKYIEAKCKEMNVSPLYYDSIGKECCSLKSYRAQRGEKFTQGDIMTVLKNYITQTPEIKKDPVRKINMSKVRSSAPKEDVMTISVNTKDKNSIIKAKKFIDCCFENIDNVDIDGAIEISKSESKTKDNVKTSEQFTDVNSSDNVNTETKEDNTIKQDLKEESNIDTKVESDNKEKTIISDQPKNINLTNNVKTETKEDLVEEVTTKELVPEESSNATSNEVVVPQEDKHSLIDDSKNIPNEDSNVEKVIIKSLEETNDIIQVSDSKDIMSDSTVSEKQQESLKVKENNTNQDLEELNLFG